MVADHGASRCGRRHMQLSVAGHLELRGGLVSGAEASMPRVPRYALQQHARQSEKSAVLMRACVSACTRVLTAHCACTHRPPRPLPALCPQLEFSSEICSGNIAEVEQLDDAGTSFKLTTAPDCAGMACVTGYRTWFYYVVRGAKRDLNLTMTVSNMNPQTKMFNQGTNFKQAHL